jgi:hypothetical protein
MAIELHGTMMELLTSVTEILRVTGGSVARCFQH